MGDLNWELVPVSHCVGCGRPEGHPEHAHHDPRATHVTPGCCVCLDDHYYMLQWLAADEEDL